MVLFFFFSSRRRHTRSLRDWSSDVCSSDLADGMVPTCDMGIWFGLGDEPSVAGNRIRGLGATGLDGARQHRDRKSTRLNSSHVEISYAVFCLKKKKKKKRKKKLQKSPR